MHNIENNICKSDWVARLLSDDLIQALSILIGQPLVVLGVRRQTVSYFRLELRPEQTRFDDEILDVA